MGVHKWKDVKASRSREVIERARRKTDAALTGLRLAGLRKHRGLTQAELADRLGAHQSGISRLEQRSNVHVDTLREVIEAMGGQLEITARFPDGEAVKLEM